MTELILKRASPSPPTTVIGVSNTTADIYEPTREAAMAAFAKSWRRE
jgi:hypothetical protein